MKTLPEQYLFDRGYPFIDPIPAESARKLFERAVRDPRAQLRGDLETGFSYISSQSGPTVLLRVTVRPVGNENPVSDSSADDHA